MYIPEIKIKYYDRWVTVHVGDIKVGTFFENEEAHKMLDQMYAKMIRDFFESQGVSFEEEQEDETW
jgi:hypothetical protein